MIRSWRAGKCREIGELMQYRNTDRGSNAIKIESRSFPDGYSDFVSTPIFEDWNQQSSYGLMKFATLFRSICRLKYRSFQFINGNVVG